VLLIEDDAHWIALGAGVPSVGVWGRRGEVEGNEIVFAVFAATAGDTNDAVGVWLQRGGATRRLFGFGDLLRRGLLGGRLFHCTLLGGQFPGGRLFLDGFLRGFLLGHGRYPNRGATVGMKPAALCEVESI
jgi:hypothetical protein